jgi:hypothetical protein
MASSSLFVGGRGKFGGRAKSFWINNEFFLKRVFDMDPQKV